MNKNNRFDNFLILLLCLLAFGDVGGMFSFVRVCAISLSPIFFVKMKFCKDYIFGILLFFLFLWSYCFLSITWTTDKFQGIKEIFYYFVHFLIFIEILVFSRFANNPLKSISYGWIGAVLLCSVVAVWELSTGNHLFYDAEFGTSYNFGDKIVQRSYASVAFYNYNTFVTFLCFAFPWLFFGLIDTDKIKLDFKTILIIYSIFISIIIILYNASRGGLLTTGFMFLIFLIFSPKIKGRNSLIILSIFAIIFILIKFGEQMLQLIIARIMYHSLTNDESRFKIWTNALKAFADTFGLGTGVGGVTAAMAEYATGKRKIVIPHNMFLEVLLTFGFVLSFAFYMFLWRLFKKSWKLTSPQIRTITLMAILAMPIYSIIDSGYLLKPQWFASLATIFVFGNYERIKLSY